jgi:hypothetical protein
MDFDFGMLSQAVYSGGMLKSVLVIVENGNFHGGMTGDRRPKWGD